MATKHQEVLWSTTTTPGEVDKLSIQTCYYLRPKKGGSRVIYSTIKSMVDATIAHRGCLAFPLQPKRQPAQELQVSRNTLVNANIEIGVASRSPCKKTLTKTRSWWMNAEVVLGGPSFGTTGHPRRPHYLPLQRSSITGFPVYFLCGRWSFFKKPSTPTAMLVFTRCSAHNSLLVRSSW